MSRAFFRQPEFRLLFGYPSLMLFRGPAGPVATASIAGPDPGAALAAIAAEVARAGGRLTAVLPEPEVWRGLLALPERAPLARLRQARAAAAGQLAARPEAVALVLGPRDAAGRTPVAAVRRDVLAEARAFLGRAGLRPAAITGAGDFPGFAAPPRFRSLPRRRVGSLWALLRPAPAAAIGGAGAVLALAVVLQSWAPTSEPPALAVEPAPALAAAPAELPALRPAPRPAGFAPPPTVEAARVPPKPLPGRGAAPVTVAARNVTLLPSMPAPKAVPALRLAELTTARARLADARPAPAFRRPAPPAAAPAATVAPAVSAAVAPASPKAVALLAAPAPLPRPSAAPPREAPAPRAAAAPPEAPARPVAAAGPAARPRPRPEVPVATEARALPTVQVASLAPAPEVAALVATALADAAAEPRIVAPVARPDRAAPAPQPARAAPAPAAKPVARREAAPQAVRVQPAQPKPVAVRRQASAKPAPAPAAKPVVRREAAPQAVRVQPAQPKPVAVRRQASAKPAPAPQPVRQRRASANPARSGLVLVGIFGSSGERRALVQLPNGKVKQVRAGDSIQGVQVSAIGSDGVRLQGAGRDAVLRVAE